MQDEIQKRLIRAGRRIPYELPALYVTQRGVTDNLFGKNEDKRARENLFFAGAASHNGDTCWAVPDDLYGAC